MNTNKTLYAIWGNERNITNTEQIQVNYVYTGSKQVNPKTVRQTTSAIVDYTAGMVTFVLANNQDTFSVSDSSFKGWHSSGSDYPFNGTCTVPYTTSNGTKVATVNSWHDTTAVYAQFFVLKRSGQATGEKGQYYSVGTGIVAGSIPYNVNGNEYWGSGIDENTSGNVGQYVVSAPDSASMASILSIPLSETENIRWYVIKSQGDGFHVDGVLYDMSKYWNVYFHDGEALIKTIPVQDAGSVATKNFATVASKTEFEYWADASGKQVTSLEMISSDIHLYAKYKDKYNVTGQIDNGNVTNGVQSVYKNENSQAMQFTCADGFVIDKIMINGEEKTGSNAGASNYVYPAQEKVKQNIAVVVTTKPAPNVSVIYNANGATSGTVPPTATVPRNTTYTLAGNTGALVKTGYEFLGWNTNASATTVQTTVNVQNKDVTVYAIWKQIDYTITYDLNGGTSDETLVYPQQHYGDATPTIADPTRASDATYDYTFRGWLPVVAPTVTGNATYVAQWEKTKIDYTITYDLNGGTSDETLVYPQQHYGDTTPTIADPTRASDATYDYTFNGWLPIVAPTVTGNATYVAQWTKTKIDYTITYDLNGGTSDETLVYPQQHYGDATPTIADPTRASDATYDYTFSGWLPVVAPTVTGNATYVAQWTKTKIDYTITYDLNGGTSDETLVYPQQHYGDATPTIADPTRASDATYDYTFNGWLPIVAPTVTGNATYVAQWTKTKIDYTITYDLNGGTSDETLVYPQQHYGDTTPTIADPTRASDATYDYTFNGWLPEVAATVTGDATYVAQWEEVPIECTIVFQYVSAGNGTVTGTVYETHIQVKQSPLEPVSPLAEVTVAPDAKYAFDYWKDENGVIYRTLAEIKAVQSTTDKVFTAYFAEDILSDPTKDTDLTKEGDGIPDRYQVVVTFTAINGIVQPYAGTDADNAKTLSTVVTLYDQNGNFAVDGIGYLASMQIPRAYANAGYDQSSEFWIPATPTTQYAITAPITFVVDFSGNIPQWENPKPGVTTPKSPQTFVAE